MWGTASLLIVSLEESRDAVKKADGYLFHRSYKIHNGRYVLLGKWWKGPVDEKRLYLRGGTLVMVLNRLFNCL